MRKSKDWKAKIKGICPCFVSELKNAVPSKSICPNPCDLSELKDLLLQHEIPDRKTIIKTMIRSGVFNKKEIIFALIEIHDTIYKSAERRVEEAIQELEKENYKVWTDDNKNLKARKDN